MIRALCFCIQTSFCDFPFLTGQNPLTTIRQNTTVLAQVKRPAVFSIILRFSSGGHPRFPPAPTQTASRLSWGGRGSSSMPCVMKFCWMEMRSILPEVCRHRGFAAFLETNRVLPTDKTAARQVIRVVLGLQILFLALAMLQTERTHCNHPFLTAPWASSTLLPT